MRLIGSIPDSFQAEEFSAFLQKQGIDNQCERMVPDSYGIATNRIWIYDEDQVAAASDWLKRFMQNPSDPIFYGHFNPAQAIKQVEEDLEAPFSRGGEGNPTDEPALIRRGPPVRAKFTLFLVFLCAALFLWSDWTMPKMPAATGLTLARMVITSPIQKELMYDYPAFYELADKLFRLYTPEQIQEPQNAPADLQFLLAKLNSTPYWQGLYAEIIERYQGSNAQPASEKTPPLFEKIREGEVWRLFTPALLHFDIFHIFFNMVWLIVLGTQLEKRLGVLRYILFILITGIISNTAQYLVGGPNFLGFSGVVCAMAGFIWIRQKKTPWEGYLLQSSTLAFIGLFIAAMFFIQLASFIMELSDKTTITTGIANTAHIAGAITGILLAYTPLFAWRPKR